MNAAELRARITTLGLSLNQFTLYAGTDARTMRRQASGTTPVTPRTISTLEFLETYSDRVCADFVKATVAVLPGFSDDDAIPEAVTDPVEGVPQSFYHACAGRVCDKLAEIRYE